ncbi:related to Pseudomonas L-fucose dehydrogenase [Cephalotrichum gorgonifer]|uniref:Related to Pseudomonas L-fucose dehydrogenase n=1 Tax=Cephalotrichum gorgonifer TaxID=2041049 RepID=A0AAE8N1P1_9PEZI|nr:related to Pseudomonas L-fucose dehydrogenase [Cephalotrichum gorgonifer]
MNSTPSQPPLSEVLPTIILGGAGFSYQTHPDPESIPVHDILRHAFDQGLRAIDTSPFYEPSEQILGRALAHPEVTSRYSRSDYVLMTKVGRTPAGFDYTPAAVRASVATSLQRLGTTYLDVVFCHDIEAVTDEDVLGAVGELIEFVRQGKIRYIGLSSYRIDLLARRARMVRERYGRPVDVIQNWAQLTLQNSRLETEGVAALVEAGVSCICSSSPLAIGLLRKGGVPRGRLGDFHPAPEELRRVVGEVADYADAQGESLARLALRYALWRAHEANQGSVGVRTIIGVSTLGELRENIGAARGILKGDLANPVLDASQIEKDEPLIEKAHAMLGEWVNWTFTIPQVGWSQELKCVVTDDGGVVNAR